MIWIAIAIIIGSVIIAVELRNLLRPLRAIVGILEASVNRAARKAGDPPISADIDVDEIRR